MELLLNMTIGGTVTACMLLLVKMTLKDKLTPKWQFYLWIILALRLMIPGLPESDISLLNHIPAPHNIMVVENTADNSAAGSESGMVKSLEGTITLKSPVTGMEQNRSFTVAEKRVNVLLYGWAVGALLMAVYLAGAYGAFYRKSKKLPFCEDAKILDLFRKCKEEAGVASDNITLCIGGTTPMLRGLLKPAILVPEGYTGEELRHVLIHELCHYKHKDILANMICSLFLCIYWFNPVMWICFYAVRRDIEILCDERVIEITGERRTYAMTLLKTALQKNQFVFATTSMQNGEKEVAKRIKHIAYFKKPKLWISMAAILVVLAAGAICLTNASENTLNLGAGSYFISVPESWFHADSPETLFYDKNGKSFGGFNLSQVDLGENKQEMFEAGTMLLPNHSQVLERKVLKENDKTLVIVNLDLDSETAAQIEERKQAGDDSPSEKINQNYIFLLPDAKVDEVYTVWANSSEVSEQKLIKVAETLQKEPYPQGYQPVISYQEDWNKTANELLQDYFQNYADAEMSIYSDISGYRIDGMKPYKDQENSWSMLHADVVVFRVDYTLNTAYPSQYSFAGGGFTIGEGNKTKSYKDQFAVFQKDNLGNATFLGFVWEENRGELGDDAAILDLINYADPNLAPEALLKLKMPYIGDNSRVSRMIGSLPLAEYGNGMELQTKQEPYGLIVNYDMTGLGDKIFASRPDKAKTDSGGWDISPYLSAQLHKNGAIILSLIDNCSSVQFKITGIAETDVPYTYYYNLDRTYLTREVSKDPRTYAEDLNSFTEYLNILESFQPAQLKGE